MRADTAGTVEKHSDTVHSKPMFFGLFRSRKPRGPRMTDSVRLYAVGDIHGRADLLRVMHDLISADAGSAGECRKVVVYLGDYVDRGENSRQVIDLLLENPLPDFENVYLMGNHEEMLLDFLDDTDVASQWMQNGGGATLFSYGVGMPGGAGGTTRNQVIQAQLMENLPGAHLEFLRGLKMYHEAGGYLFVHAGISPEVPFLEQGAEDLLWIRDDFLNSEADFGKCVVHGHSIVPEPVILSNRIAIDTGAFYSNRLTCLVLEGDEQRFLRT